MKQALFGCASLARPVFSFSSTFTYRYSSNAVTEEHMGRVIVVANQKGGVGKTTTTVNLSAALAIKGRKVLVIDIDPQGNATSGLGVDKFSLEATMYDVFGSVFNLSSVIVGTPYNGLWVAPANGDLVGSELEIMSIVGRENILKNQIGSLTSQFDYIFIDCPPSLGMLTVNALVASDSLLVPLQCEYYALEGISSLMQAMKLAQNQLNPALDLEGIVLTMYDGRTNLSRQVEAEARKFFNGMVFKTVIPRSIRLSECPSFGKPIFAYDSTSLGALAYKTLSEEFEKRLRKMKTAEPRAAAAA
jgi:chromosome partitioning protein